MISVQIRTYNNEETILAAIQSVLPLMPDIHIIDSGSTDNTLKIASEYISNRKNDWVLSLEPWETLSIDNDIIGLKPNNYRVFVVSGEIITKPVRLWYKETPCLSYSEEYPICSSIVNSSLAMENGDFYNDAIVNLQKGNYKEFLRNANKYLFYNENDIMMHYYLAWYNCMVAKDQNEAIKNLLVCLVHRPRMAEFWCLMGDIYYFIVHDFVKSHRFYEIGIKMGESRKMEDSLPVQLSRYRDYPEKMMESCKKIMFSLSK